MSLRVWLPLKGDLTNNGTYNAAVTNTSATVDTNGKIGSCYRFNKNAYITIAKEAVSTIDSGECSFCLWLNINSFNAAWDTYVQFGLGTTPWVAYTMGLLRNGSASNLVFAISNGSTSSQTSYTTPNVTFGQWFHIACVYKPGHCLIYINGTLYADNATSLVPNFSAVTAISLGGLPSTYKTDTYINDFRIYDHALSAKEVKEISKGLILHLPLDNNNAGMPNLLTNSADLTKWTKTSNTTVTWDDSKKLYKITYSGTDTTRYGVYQDLTIEPNTTYTVSCTLSGTSCGVAFGFFDSTAGWPTTVISVTGDGRKSYTLTSGANSTKARVFLLTNASKSKEAWFRLPKLEKSAVETPWCPNSAETAYTSLGFNTATVYDVSGYGNNGTMSSTKPTAASDAPRYNSSMIFNGDSYIFLQNINIGNIWSYGVWFKSAPSSRGWEGLILLNNNGGDTDMQLGFYTYPGGSRLQSTANGQWNSSISHTYDNNWHHLFATFDGSNLKTYKDGVLINTKAITSALLSRPNLTLGARCKGTTYDVYFVGSMSDFRIYATELSAEDIMELYRSPVSIDNGGTIHAYGFTENGAANNISKQGIVSTGIDQAHYLVPNFSETGNLTGWTVGSGGALTNGVIVLTGSNISVTSAAFPVGANDIICVEFTVSVPTPSTTTNGPGIYIGTQYGQTNRAISFNFSTNKYNTEGSGTSTNTYFLNSYNSASTNCVRTYIIGSDVDINKVPAAQRSVNTHDINIIRILSGTTTYIRTGYNSNTSMVINISDFKIYKINQHGICENAGEKSIGKGYLSFANYNEI